MEAPENLHCLARNGLREMAGPQAQGPGAEERRRSSIRVGTAALSREVAGGGLGDRLRDRHNGQIRAGHQRPPGVPRPASAAGEGCSALELLCIMYARLEEGRAGDGHRGGHRRGVVDGGGGDKDNHGCLSPKF